MTLSRRIYRFLISEDGPAAVEYAVMIALIIAIVIVSVQTVGTRTSAVYKTAATKLP